VAWYVRCRLIGATGNNGLGVAGVNWNSKILPVRVLGRCGGYDSDIVDGMRWAAGLSVPGVPSNPNPAKVVNVSLGGTGSCSTTYQNAINNITSAGSVVVTAAGTSIRMQSTFTPANCNGVITVAGTDYDGLPCYSNSPWARTMVRAWKSVRQDGTW
jgi:serine protease